MRHLSLRLGDTIEACEPLVVFLTFLLVQAIVVPRQETRLGLLYFCMSFWTPFITMVAFLLFVYPIGLSETPTLSRVTFEWARLMLLVPLPSLLASTAILRCIAWGSDQIRRAASGSTMPARGDHQEGQGVNLRAWVLISAGFVVPCFIVTLHHRFSPPWPYSTAVWFYWLELALWPGSRLFWGSGVDNLWPYWLVILAAVNGAYYCGVAWVFGIAFTRRKQ